VERSDTSLKALRRGRRRKAGRRTPPAPTHLRRPARKQRRCPWWGTSDCHTQRALSEGGPERCDAAREADRRWVGFEAARERTCPRSSRRQEAALGETAGGTQASCPKRSAEKRKLPSASPQKVATMMMTWATWARRYIERGRFDNRSQPLRNRRGSRVLTAW